MAKETEKKFSIKDLTSENVIEQLENAGKYGKDIIEMAKKNREEKDKEKAAKDFDELSQKAEYFNFRLCLMAKMYKDASKACDKARNDSLELFKRVEAGELDAIGFENEQNKLAKEFTKNLDKSREERRDSETRLRNKFPSGNWWSWDNEFFNQISAAIRRMTEK
jgi:hypothetical protein